MKRFPTHDADGLHVLDPRDRSGRKSTYITRLQHKALRRYLPPGNGELAVDLGCGYGRLTPLLGELGWEAVGVDPADKLIEFAKQHFPGPRYLVGGLPRLPFREGSIGLLLFNNVLRSLLLLGRLESSVGVGRFLVPGGWVCVVENIRQGHHRFIDQQWLLDWMASEGLQLVRRVPIRAARWWGIYAVRYGIVPRWWYERLAEYEMRRMERKQGSPRFQYWNVLFLFVKKDGMPSAGDRT